MPQKPQISLLLRAIQADMRRDAELAANDSTGGSSARLAHLMAAADMALVAAELIERGSADEALMLMSYELGRAMGPVLAPKRKEPTEADSEDISDFDTEP